MLVEKCSEPIKQIGIANFTFPDHEYVPTLPHQSRSVPLITLDIPS